MWMGCVWCVGGVWGKEVSVGRWCVGGGDCLSCTICVYISMYSCLPTAS